MSNNKQTAVNIIIKGKVQGVGYRYFTLKKAQELHIIGWVKNQSDGTVALFGQGNKRNLELLIAILKQGPSFSKVDEVIVNWEHAQAEYIDFVII